MKIKPINVYTGNKADDEKYIKELVERRRKAYQDEGVATDHMKNKEDDICVCNSTGEFVDWLLDTIRNDMHKCSRLKDSKGLSALNFLLNKIEDKLAEE